MLVPSPALAQFPPTQAKNLKVLPADIPMDTLIARMAGFTRALGVRCTYCHVGREGAPLDSFDFPADDKPEKAKARVMLKMLAAINTEHLTQLASRREPRINVTCATCHHGIAQPRSLEDVLLTTYDAAGTDSLEATYRTLRQRYYGRAVYDFGEVALVDVGDRLRLRGRLPDALRVYALNTQVTPTSGFAFRSLAGGQLASGDTVAAIASLEAAVRINANDQQAKRALERLARKPR